MKLNLKPLNEQVMVITGATSGIGLVTARMAADAGVRLVLSARNEDMLAKLAREVSNRGSDAIYVVADVGNVQDVRRIAQAAVEYFGGFDTWVNNAGVSIYGRITQVAVEDHRRLFDTNFWGVVHGSCMAVEHLRLHGGALINVGSVLSDRAIPLQGMYCASKHAVKGFTDSLRMELEEEDVPISVSLIKPSAIDTPYTTHARNYLPNEPQNPPPVYAPELVARAILHCAQRPMRDVTVGLGGKIIATAGSCAPRLLDRVMERTMFRAQKTERPRRTQHASGLYAPMNGNRERGDYEGHVCEHDLYTEAVLHPVVTGTLLAAAALLVTGVIWNVSKRGEATSKNQRFMGGPVRRSERDQTTFATVDSLRERASMDD